MTPKQHQDLLNFYKMERAGERNEQALKDAHQSAQLEIDRLRVDASCTVDAQEFLKELELLIFV